MSTAPNPNPRVRALRQPRALTAFEAIQHLEDVFRRDPFDVEDLHRDARQVFDELIERAQDADPAQSGRSLLIRGAAGSGKTHLLRAFRSRVHERGLGFVSYVQMTTAATNYLRYLLRQVIRSLTRPFDHERGSESALDILSDRLVALPGICPPELLDELRTTEDHATARRLAWKLGNRILNGTHRDRLARIDEEEVVFQLLFLQNRDSLVHRAVHRFLNCEELSPREQEILGTTSRADDDHPRRVLETLAMLTSVLHGGAFVICIDQLEDVLSRDPAAEAGFQRAMNAVRELTDSVPNLVVVVACLTDTWYEVFEKTMTQSLLDRLGADPAPCDIDGTLSLAQVRDVVGARVAFGLEQAGIAPDPERPWAPFTDAGFESLRNLRVRDVLKRCAAAIRQTADDAERIELAPAPDANAAAPATSPATVDVAPRPTAVDWSRVWNDFVAEFEDPSDITDEQASARALADALPHVAQQVGVADAWSARAVANRVHVDVATGPLVIGICERNPRGGGLHAQLEDLRRHAGTADAVLLRTAPFPKTTSSLVAKALTAFVRAGNRRVKCDADAWSTMRAWPRFVEIHGHAADLLDWARATQPLASMQVFRDVLGDALSAAMQVAPRAAQPAAANAPADRGSAAVARRTAPDADPDAAPSTATGPERIEPDRIELGHRLGIERTRLDMPLAGLARHAAFLGGTGSGKTTLALSVVEQALRAGIPVLAIDRKGDLARYADPHASQQEPDGQRAAALRDFQAAVDVALFTPGDPRGRDLAIPILPQRRAATPAHERVDLVARYAATLASMLGGSPRSESTRRSQAILTEALQLLDEHLGRRVRIEDLIEVLAPPDPGLLLRLTSIDPKHATKLAEALQTLRITERRLLANDATEVLDVAALLGLDAPTGRPRFAILSAAAVAEPMRLAFLVAHVLSDLQRLARERPDERLQALVLLDEADRYMPAVGEPPTKELLLDGLRRFRSAGIGLLLATQSPGDLDYRGRDNIQTWFVGKVTQSTALRKLEPLFGTSPGCAQRIPEQDIGQFHRFADGRAEAFQADRNLLTTRQLGPDDVARLAAAARLQR